MAKSPAVRSLLQMVARRRRRRQEVQTPLMLLSPLLLAACGGSGSEAGPSGNPPAPANPNPPAPPAGPTAVADTLAVAPGAGVQSGNVLANDTGAATLTVSAVSVAGGSGGGVGTALTLNIGTLTVNADGGYSFTPNAAVLQALGAGQTASAQVTYTAQNSAGSASTTLTLTATGVNDAPVAGADAALTVAPGSTTTFTPTAPTDVDTGDTVQVRVVALPAAGTVQLADGTPLTVGATLTVAQLANLRFVAPVAVQAQPVELVLDAFDQAGAADRQTIGFTVQVGGSGGSGGVFVPSHISLALLDGTNGVALQANNGATLSDLGAGLSGGGDYNGDGIADLVVGAPGARSAYILLGGAAFGSGSFDLTAGGSRVFTVTADIESFGTAVAFRGNLGGDARLDEVVIGAPLADGERGIAYILYDAPGSGDILTLERISSIAGNQGPISTDSGDRIGEVLVYLDDFDGDGVGELVLAATGRNAASSLSGGQPVEDSGLTFLLDGSAITPDAPARIDDLTAIATIPGNGQLGEISYLDVASGDINDDGVRDLVFGSPYYSPSASNIALPGDLDGGDFIDRAGGVFVRFGPAAALDGESASQGLATAAGAQGFTITIAEDISLAGASVAVGDLNGDGIDDIALGIPNTYAFGGVGAVVVVFGAADLGARSGGAIVVGPDGVLHGVSAGAPVISGVVFTPVPEAQGDAVDTLFGFSVDFIGDFNGDGIDDLAIGAPEPGAGAAYVVFGRETFADTVSVENADPTSILRIDGGLAGTGERVAGIGDINNDGFADLAVSAVGDGDGTVYLVFGHDPALPPIA